jgi:hypothetical protein
MAVQHGYGKVAGADALVFAYDTGDTRNSYKGEPTTNLISSDGLDMSTLGSYTLLTRSRVADNSSPSGYACEMEIQDGATINGASRIQFGNATSIPTSGNVFVSVYAKFQGGPISNIVPRVYTGYNWYDMAPLDGGSIYLTSEYRRFGVYVQVGTNSGGPNPGFSMTHNNSNRQTAQKTRWHSPQVELKLHVTPFTSGSRLSTQGLLDLTRNRSIELASVSFNTNAQLEFDGSDDLITFGSAADIREKSYTVEAVFNRYSTNRTDGIIGDLQYHWFSLYVNSSNQLYFFHRRNNPYTDNGAISTTGLVGTGYYHAVGVFDITAGMRVYLNGNLVASNSNTTAFDLSGRGPQYIGQHRGGAPGSPAVMSGQIPVLKIYLNKALTANEVRNNYNHYKTRFNI